MTKKKREPQRAMYFFILAQANNERGRHSSSDHNRLDIKDLSEEKGARNPRIQ